MGPRKLTWWNGASDFFGCQGRGPFESTLRESNATESFGNYFEERFPCNYNQREVLRGEHLLWAAP